MKMLVKVSKNPNATLYSDIEEKGKGKRFKKPIKYFEESDKENLIEERCKVQMLPSIPKLTNVSKSARQPLPDKTVKRQTLSCINKQQYSKSVPHEIKKYTHKSYKECKRIQESSHLLTEMPKSTFIIASENNEKNFLSGCKIDSKMNHKCAYNSEGEVTLESLADAICYLNGMLKILFTYILCKILLFLLKYIIFIKIYLKFKKLLLMQIKI